MVAAVPFTFEQDAEPSVEDILGKKDLVERHLAAAAVSCQTTGPKVPWNDTYNKICGSYGALGSMKTIQAAYRKTTVDLESRVSARYSAMSDFSAISPDCRRKREDSRARARTDLVAAATLRGWSQDVNPGLCKKDAAPTACFCLAQEFAAELAQSLASPAQARLDSQVKPIVQRVEASMDAALAESKFSEGTRARLQAYLNKNPIDVALHGGGTVDSIHLTSEGLLGQTPFNAYYSAETDQMLFEPATIDVLRQDPVRGEQMIGAIVAHELGHRLEMILTAMRGLCSQNAQLKCSPELLAIARELSPADVRILQHTTSCLDRNSSYVEDIFNRGAQAWDVSVKGKARKRIEGFGDLMAKHYLRGLVSQLPVGEARANLLYGAMGEFCDSRGVTKTAIFVEEAHENPQTRIATILSGLIPLSGESLGLAEPEQCDLQLFTK